MKSTLLSEGLTFRAPIPMLLVLVLSLASILSGAAPARFLPLGERPNDQRLQPPKDLDGYFPFSPPASRETWAERSEELRRQILVSQGLWPMPTRTPLNPVIHGLMDRGDYTVEKVFFESMPGFYVTGSLYRPKGREGKLAGVLCPHGHWNNGRFLDTQKEIQSEIANGAERFEEGGRSVLQARCVQLARMGCVVFHYDMIGYADSVQISEELAHRFSKQRPEMNTAENWGLFSPQAEAHSQSVMGLQTWNSIRSLDFLLSLPEVDASRVGVTGASGGGTQTFILGAIDPRPTVAFPAVMICTAMQGGCTCENASGLRIDTGNVEIAALFAPKPLGMTGADDWTKEMSTKGSPELKRHFAMLGHPENLLFRPLNQFGHNYNYPSRAVMYGFMNHHLKLGVPEPVVERDYRRLTTEELSVWDEKHPKPTGGPDFERRLLRHWHADSEAQLSVASKSQAEFRKVFGQGWQAVVGRSIPRADELNYDQRYKQDRGRFWAKGGLLRQPARNEESPVLFFYPKEWNGRTAIWIHPEGKSGLCDPAAAAFSPSHEVQRLLDAGIAVAGIDLIHQGESLVEGEAMLQTPRVKNPRESAAFTAGYNSTVFAQRVHDVIKLVSFVKHYERPSKSIDLIGLAGAGPWVAVARAVLGDQVTSAAVDTSAFRFGSVPTIQDPAFLPGAAKYGDLPGALALGAPGKLWLAGETSEGNATVRTGYQRASSSPHLSLAASGTASAAVDWLLAP